MLLTRALLFRYQIAVRRVVGLKRRISVFPSTLKSAVSTGMKPPEVVGPNLPLTNALLFKYQIAVGRVPPVSFQQDQRRIGLDEKIETLWRVSERETGVKLDVKRLQRSFVSTSSTVFAFAAFVVLARNVDPAGAWAIVGQGGLILKRGHELDPLLRFFIERYAQAYAAELDHFIVSMERVQPTDERRVLDVGLVDGPTGQPLVKHVGAHVEHPRPCRMHEDRPRLDSAGKIEPLPALTAIHAAVGAVMRAQIDHVGIGCGDVGA